MILGQWFAIRPGTAEDVGYRALRDLARYYGVTKPILSHWVTGTPIDAAMLGTPYPAECWTWKGEVNLLALPKHLIGSNPHSYVLDGPGR